MTNVILNPDFIVPAAKWALGPKYDSAYEDASHQAIANMIDGKRGFEVKDNKCVACNLYVDVHPITDCITMEQLAPGALDERTGQRVEADYANWTVHPNNPPSAPTSE